MKWKNGFYFDDEAPDGALKIENEQYEQLLQGQSEGLTIEELDGMPMLVDCRPDAETLNKERIRQKRMKECFVVINRGELWYSRLTEMQRAELDAWYSAWLEAPQSKMIPEKLTWLED